MQGSKQLTECFHQLRELEPERGLLLQNTLHFLIQRFNTLGGIQQADQLPIRDYDLQVIRFKRHIRFNQAP